MSTELDKFRRLFKRLDIPIQESALHLGTMVEWRQEHDRVGQAIFDQHGRFCWLTGLSELWLCSIEHIDETT